MRIAAESHSGHYSGAGNDDDSGCATEEYAWTPTGLTPEQVSCNVQILTLTGIHFFIIPLI